MSPPRGQTEGQTEGQTASGSRTARSGLLPLDRGLPGAGTTTLSFREDQPPRGPRLARRRLGRSEGEESRVGVRVHVRGPGSPPRVTLDGPRPVSEVTHRSGKAPAGPAPRTRVAPPLKEGAGCLPSPAEDWNSNGDRPRPTQTRGGAGPGGRGDAATRSPANPPLLLTPGVADEGRVARGPGAPEATPRSRSHRVGWPGHPHCGTPVRESHAATLRARAIRQPGPAPPGREAPCPVPNVTSMLTDAPPQPWLKQPVQAPLLS